MTGLKKILHPTDFSENASQALAYAHELSRKLNAALIIMHGADVPTIMNSDAVPSFKEMEELKKASIVEQLKKYYKDHIGSIPAGNSVDFDVVLAGSSARGIMESAEKNNADMVVMGAKGQSRMKEVIMGSTTKKLVAKSEVPVLVIPENFQYKEINRIVYASDFNEHDIDALRKVAEIANSYNAVLVVLHIFFAGEEKEKEMLFFKTKVKEQLQYANLEYDFRIANHVEHTIAEYLTETRADLLVMYEKEKSLLSKLLGQDRVEPFSTHASIPLLVYNTLNLAP